MEKKFKIGGVLINSKKFKNWSYIIINTPASIPRLKYINRKIYIAVINGSKHTKQLLFSSLFFLLEKKKTDRIIAIYI